VIKSDYWSRLANCAFNLHTLAFGRGDDQAMRRASILFKRYHHKYKMAVSAEKRRRYN
jgi:hypothetical protein